MADEDFRENQRHVTLEQGETVVEDYSGCVYDCGVELK